MKGHNPKKQTKVEIPRKVLPSLKASGRDRWKGLNLAGSKKM